MIINNTNDTICAISTPSGIGGIAVIRVSGPDAITIVNSLWKGRNLTDANSHTVHLGELGEKAGEPIDQCVATIFRDLGHIQVRTSLNCRYMDRNGFSAKLWPYCNATAVGSPLQANIPAGP